MLKRFLLLILPALVHAQQGVSPEISARMNWPERIAEFDPGSKNEAWTKTGLDDRGWSEMALPAHFDRKVLPGYDGVVWFRKTVTLQQAGVGRLNLGPIDDMDVTWVNGIRVGGHEKPGHHYTNRSYVINRGVLKKGKNTIAVRVMDHGWSGGIAGKAGQMALEIGETRIPLAGLWKYKAGVDLNTLVDGPPRPNTELPPFDDGAFALLDDEVIAFTGGGSMVKVMENGTLELLLTRWAANKRIRFRDSAWQADTVYLRQRPRNFGHPDATLARIKATTIFAGFGQMEAMDGIDRLPDFVAAYEHLLDEYAVITPRIVLVTPFILTSRPDLAENVIKYSEAIVQLATRRDLPCIEMHQFVSGKLYLDRRQQQQYGLSFMKQLTGETPEAWQSESLHKAIQEKNRLWRQHWRPANWAFAYGNRTHVPSSHDHRKGQPRWMPQEIRGILRMVEEADSNIATLRAREVRP